MFIRICLLLIVFSFWSCDREFDSKDLLTDQELNAIEFLNSNGIQNLKMHDANFESKKLIADLPYEGVDISYHFQVDLDRNFVFQTWMEDCEYVEEGDGGALQTLVSLNFEASLLNLSSASYGTLIYNDPFTLEERFLYYIDFHFRPMEVSYFESSELTSCPFQNSIDNEDLGETTLESVWIASFDRAIRNEFRDAIFILASDEIGF